MNKAGLGIVFFAVFAAATGAQAQSKIYRCGNDYTNEAGAAKRQGCRLVEGGNVTVIQNTAPTPAPRAATSTPSAAPRQSSSPASAPKVDDSAQRSRDADARTILEAELSKSQQRLAALQEEYNGGEPQRTALEFRNPQGYIERIAQLKANIERTEADIQGIQREINRLR
ncbi:hypothetical protein [Lampropedia aestuarii]|uniref:hypothetical protein n=1 Tax=Lampropedia aestuarii TaxID=2562762 RepID=UPI002468DB69|nr:hypothetical protein [Lampropedia aestuarii]MDH5858348.1 hypothetical protein [Lampropedia aestuarii]